MTRAPGVGVHRPDVDLVAVARRTGRAVVADRERQEVEHQVRVGDVVVRPDEAAALEVVRRARARGAGTATAAPMNGRRHFSIADGCIETGWVERVLDVDLEVVLEVLARRPGRSATTSMPSAPELGRPAPTPDSWSSCGELIAPPERMTSPAADASRCRRALRSISTPIARRALEARSGSRTSASGPRGSARSRTGWRYARAALIAAAAADVPVERARNPPGGSR